VEEIFFSFRDRARKPSAVRGKSEQHGARCEAALAGPTCHHVLLQGRKDYEEGQSRSPTPSFISGID
jgi:hypothetical protein